MYLIQEKIKIHINNYKVNTNDKFSKLLSVKLRVGVLSLQVSEEYRQTGLREVWAPPVTVSGVNSAVEEQRLKLRFTGASCQSEEPRSTGAMVTCRLGRRAPAGCCR